MANKLKITPLSPTGETPTDFYSWGDGVAIGIVSRREQAEEALEGAFDSIEISEDTSTPELDYVLRVLGRDAGRVIIPFDMVVKEAYYDKDTKEIVLVIATKDGDKTLRINVGDLVDTYTGDEVTIHVENNVISIKDEVMNKFDELHTFIVQETTDRTNADKTLKEELEAEIAALESDTVKWVHSTEDRKHIVLANHDNLLGTSTDGTTYNLAMVSKWDVADFGTSQLPMNLNSKDGKVTINDDKVVATLDDIPTLEDVATKEYVNETVSDATKNMVEWEYSTEDRKHIVLDNHSNILGTSTDGTTYNLAMVSKWDVADFGTSSLHTNLNSKDGVVTINDNQTVATKEYVDEQVATKADKVHTHEVSDVNGLQTALDSKLNADDVQAIFKSQIYKLFNIDMVTPVEFLSKDISDPTVSYAVVGNGETILMSQPKNVTAKSVKFSTMGLQTDSANSASLNVSSNEVELENVMVSGSWDRSKGGNSMININDASSVNISNVNILRSGGYNGIEMGLSDSGKLQSVVIDGLKVSAEVANNALNMFSFADDAIVTIKNCDFGKVSNAIRISNATDAKNVSIIVKDCTVTQWDTTQYAGLILLQNFTNTDRNQFRTFTITLDNVTGPNGKILPTTPLSELCGSGANQVIYIYVGSASSGTILPYSDGNYPTVTVK